MPPIQVDGGKSLLHLLSEANTDELEKKAQQREAQLEVFGPMAALLLCSGLDINAIDHRGMSCIHSAAKQSTHSFLASLFKRGADPTRIARGKQTIFHFAAYNHDAEAWRVILSAIPDPFPLIILRNRAGVTPLQLCCILGNAAGVAACCKFFTAPLQIIDMSVNSLSVALKRGKDASPAVLLTDALRKKPTKEFLATIFQQKSPADIAEVLNKRRKGMGRQRWPEGGSWLHYAAHNSAEDSISALTRFGALSFLDESGFLPLHYALRRSLSTASISLALSMTTDNWQVVDTRKRSFLHWICCFAAPPPGLNKNSNIELRVVSVWNPFWRTIVTQAPPSSQEASTSVSSQTSILSSLCQNSALTGPDQCGNRPIHLLAMRDLHGYAMEILCQHTKSKERWSVTPLKQNGLHLASQNRSPAALMALLKYLELDSIAQSVNKDSILNRRDSRGRTPLHHAILSANPQCIQALLDAGAMPTICDRKGLTPVTLAAKYNGLMALIQLIDNGVCSLEEVRSDLTDAGFRSSIPELESLKGKVERAIVNSDPSLMGESAPAPPPRIHVFDPTRPASIIDARADGIRFDLNNIPTSFNYDVREGERYPLYRRCGSAPSGDTLSMLPGWSSPRNMAAQISSTMITSSSAPNWAAPRSPTITRLGNSTLPKNRVLSVSDEIHREFIRDGSIGSMHSASSDDDSVVGSPIVLNGLSSGLHPNQSLYINLDHLANRNKPSRSLSTSPPRSPLGTVINPWGGPASPTSAPLSPHLSPRSMSPSAGRQTPPTTPNSSSFDRMKLHRSLSPRSLPTIKETSGNTPTDAAAKDTKPSTGRRQRSGSNSSLAKKALLARSRSLTKLPGTGIGEDFLEQIKMDQAPGYGGGGTTPRAYTLHPGSLDQHYGNLLGGHAKSHSDHGVEDVVSKPSVSPKKRHKSQDRQATSQGKKSTRSSPAAAPNALIS